MKKTKDRYIEMQRRQKHCLNFLASRHATQVWAAIKLGVTKQHINQFIHGKYWSQQVADFFEYKRED